MSDKTSRDLERAAATGTLEDKLKELQDRCRRGEHTWSHAIPLDWHWSDPLVKALKLEIGTEKVCELGLQTDHKGSMIVYDCTVCPKQRHVLQVWWGKPFPEPDPDAPELPEGDYVAEPVPPDFELGW